jgi:hypothetical protein
MEDEIGRHVACMRRMRNAYKIWLGNLKVRCHVDDIDVYGKIILEWVLGK